MTALSADQINVTLGGTTILEDVSFDVDRGTWTGLLGPNGSGKTTLLRAVAGLVPHTGRVTLLGIPLAAWSARLRARRLAFVRQSVGLTFDFTVGELVGLGRGPHKAWLEGANADDRHRVQAALERVGLEGFTSRSALSLSGGELQRAFLAQALVQEADVLLLDEPTAHLDVHFQYEMMDVVRHLVDNGRTVVAVFHDLTLAARYADQLLVLSDGRLAESGPPRTVLTEATIAAIFRMRARVEHLDAGRLHIHYLDPIPRHENLYAHR